MTENHGYETPEKGTNDWHTPLNSNFRKLEADVEIRDVEEQLKSYQPKDGAKFFAIDTGNVFIGDGSEWSAVPVADHDHQKLSVSDSFHLPTMESDPESPVPGEVWFRRDTGEVRIGTQDGPQVLSYATDADGDEQAVSYDVTESFSDSSWTDTFGDNWDYGLDAHATLKDISGRDGTQLDAMVPGGENRGIYTVHNHETRTGSAPTACYHKFAMRFEPGFADRITDDGKLPGFAGRDNTNEGAGGTPASGTGWSARMAWDDPEDHRADIVPTWYIYHMDASGSYGEHDTWDVSFNEGQWYEIEQYIDLGKPNANDGVLRSWVDGSLKYERTDLRWRKSGGNDVQWSWWDLYHGGGETPNGDLYIQFNDLGIVRGGMP